ncbi:MAG: V-type ATPase 116kDa subunit family protein [bacterium]
MFKPAKMDKIDLQVPQDHMAKTTQIIANLKILHLMNVRKTRIGELNLESNADSSLLQKYTDLKNRLDRILNLMEINLMGGPEPVSPENLKEEANPHQDITQLDWEVQHLEDEVSGVIGELDTVEKARKQKEELLRQLEIITAAGVDIDRFRRCRFLYVAAGLIPLDNLGRMEFSLSNLYHLIVPSVAIDKQRLIFVFGSRRDRDKIDRALRSAYFDKLEIPEQDENPDLRSLENLRTRIRELEAEKSVIQARMEKMKKQLTGRLDQLRHKVLLSIAVLEIGKSYDKVGQIYHISGWVPQRVVPLLEREVLEATDNQVRVAVVSSNAVWQIGDLLKIPTCFQNPFLLRPFEKLVAGYGIPSYREVEPTFFFALSFLVMFGVMFGDVGQGLVLFLLGLFAYRKSARENVRDACLIIMECGIMSTIFGFLYGSVFGFEHLIPALWFNPMGNIYYFMKITVGFGMLVISIGLILNIVNSIENRNYKEGILGEFGIISLIFYWGCIGLALPYLTTGKLPVNAGYLLPVLPLSLMVLFLKEPLFNLYGRLVLKKNLPILPDKPGLYFMESLIEIGDTVIAFLSHTVSFVRVSAFALAHAGLFLAVFTLARTSEGMRGGTLWYGLIVVLGNIGIITIEGLVVSIQTIRLEYYEFFTKFFQGGGEIYRPLQGIQ